ncbi:unnamed protein product, partial [marine sediment metagenome]
MNYNQIYQNYIYQCFQNICERELKILLKYINILIVNMNFFEKEEKVEHKKLMKIK